MSDDAAAVSQAYSLGDQVWLRVEGFPWWPGRIVTPSQIGLDEEPQAGMIYAQFYSTEDAFVGSPQDVCPLEFESEKAFVDSPELQEAIALARGGASGPLKRPRDSTGGEGVAPTLDMDDAALLLDTDARPSSPERDAHKDKKHKKDKKDKKDKKEKHRERDREKRHRDEPSQQVPKQHRPSVVQSKKVQREPKRNERAASPKELSQVIDHPIAASHDEVIGFAAEIDSIMQASTVDLSTLRSILIRLSRLTVDIHVLQSTRIGLSLTRVLRNDQCARVAPLAQAILVAWVGCLPENMRNALRTSQTQLAGITPASSLVIHHEQKDFKQNIRNRFANLLDSHDVAALVEAALFEAHQGNASEVFRLLEAALKKNVPLREDLVAGRLQPDIFVRMSHEELLTQEERDNIQQLKREATQQQLYLSEIAVHQVTDMFPCEKCGNAECTYYQQQMRSADEPPTMFLTCLKCKHSFRAED
jgi:transcription elongation factor S-II